MSGIYKEYKAKGVEILEVAFRDDAEAVKQFVKTYNVPFPVAMVDGDYFVKWAQITPEMRPTVPITFFINRNGYIVGQYMGAEPFNDLDHVGENVRAKLKGMLEQEPPPRRQPARRKK